MIESNEESHSIESQNRVIEPVNDHLYEVVEVGEEQEKQEEDQEEEHEEEQEEQESAEISLESFQKEIEQLQAQSQEYLDGWQRARAELANARRRFERERAEAIQYTMAELIRTLLPVSDDFERALATVPDDMRDQSWVEGILMIRRKLQLVFESMGVSPIAVQSGDEFDPTIHEAMSQEETEEYESGEIIAEVQKGYWLGENVLRPTLVRVAK